MFYTFGVIVCFLGEGTEDPTPFSSSSTRTCRPGWLASGTKAAPTAAPSAAADRAAAATDAGGGEVGAAAEARSLASLASFFLRNSSRRFFPARSFFFSSSILHPSLPPLLCSPPRRQSDREPLFQNSQERLKAMKQSHFRIVAFPKAKYNGPSIP